MAFEHGVCDACGAKTHYTFTPVITPLLARQWKMTETQTRSMSMRESMYCLFCGSSYRLRLLARAISYLVAGNADQSLQQRIKSGQMDEIRIAEINSCGVLHDILRHAPGLSYSEYVPSDESVRREDIENLTYESESFDLVLTSDVLEHVPDVNRALQETYRVLRPGGAHIMTVPLLMDRKTRIRAKREKNGSINKLLTASHHGSGEDDYLVWSEFGSDFALTCKKAGFDAYYVFENTKNKEDISGVVIALKAGESDRLSTKLPSDDYAYSQPSDWNDYKLSELSEKTKLTLDHINNLQAALDATVDDNQKKAEYIRELEARGLRYHVKRRLNATGRRRDRQ